jgi:WD40 repeat protein
MKFIILIALFFFSLLNAAKFSDKLPLESKQFIDSFSCFSSEEKEMLYYYLLALKYRIEHVDQRDALIDTELDYWRLWHIVSDMENRCRLHYRFDKILEETLLQNEKEKERLKRLRRVEGSIHVDGASEFSEKMRRYDKKLQKKILSNPPKFHLMPKGKHKPDYNLTALKHYPPKSIPKNIYDQIEKMHATPHQKEILRRVAYLKEEMIRNYDQPQRRKRLEQELLYLSECQKRDGIYTRGEFYHNFKRKLASRVIATRDYSLKYEFLPLEIASYCEHNITHTELKPFVPQKDPLLQTNATKKVIRLKHLTAYLKQYENNPKKKKYAAAYLSLMKRLLQKESAALPNIDALKLLRLKSCLVGDNDDEDFKLIFSRVKDFRIEGLKERFYGNIFYSQLWWKTTINMKKEAEGDSPELAHFFDCNATQLLPFHADLHSKEVTLNPQKTFSVTDMRNGIKHKDKILKHYAYLFENIPTPDLNNTKAIKHGLISKQWIGKGGKIKTPFGKNVIIEGMPKGGIKLTYTGIPKGKLCTDFIQINKNDVIFFNQKSYDGIDYIMVNDDKIKLDHFIYKHLQRVCNKKENNTVSFIREMPIKEHINQPKSLDSAFDRVKSIQTIDLLRYEPNGAAFLPGVEHFMISGSVAKLYDTNVLSNVKKLPGKLENSFSAAISPDGKYLAVGRYGSDIHIWDIIREKFVKTIKQKGIGKPKLFLPDSKTLLVTGEKISFINIENEKNIATIKPHNIANFQKYNRMRIDALAISPDGTILCMGGNKGVIERWQIKRSHSGADLTVSYIDTIEAGLREIGALLFDKHRKDTLIIASRKKQVKFYDTRAKRIIQTYEADGFMGAKEIVISDDSEYMLITGDHGAFLWKLGTKEQYDIINGNKIVGGIFLKNSSKFILMAKEVKIWKVNK